MVSNRRMQGESLFGSGEIYHPDIGKLDDCPHSIKPKYSLVLNIRDADWVCSEKLSKEWNGGGCILSDMRLAEESTDQLLVPICAFHVLVNNLHFPWKWNFSRMHIYFLPSDLYLVDLSEVFDLTVFSCLLSNFKNPACSKILRVEKTKNKKTWWP